MTGEMDFSNLSDSQLIALLVSNDQHIIEVFFKKTCLPLLNKLNWKIFNNKLETGMMAEYLKMYLEENDWHRLKSFKGESSLFGWLKVTAAHYFYNNRQEFLPELTKPPRAVPLKKRFNFDDAYDDDIDLILNRMDDPLLCEFIRLRHVEKLTDDEIIHGILSGAEKKFRAIERSAYALLKRVIENEGEYYANVFIVPDDKFIEVDEDHITEEPSVNETSRTITRIDVQEALSKLDDRDRYVLRSLIIEDRKRGDVAEELGVDPSYLDIIRNRALKKIKRILVNQ